MAGERTLMVELDDGGTLVIVAEQVGQSLVADVDIVAKLSTITSAIERVCRGTLDAVRRAGPTKATVELGFGLAVEAGQLVALFGKGKGEATIKVTLEWSRDAADPGGQGAPDPQPAADGES